MRYGYGSAGASAQSLTGGCVLPFQCGRVCRAPTDRVGTTEPCASSGGDGFGCTRGAGFRRDPRVIIGCMCVPALWALGSIGHVTIHTLMARATGARTDTTCLHAVPASVGRHLHGAVALGGGGRRPAAEAGSRAALLPQCLTELKFSHDVTLFLPGCLRFV